MGCSHGHFAKEYAMVEITKGRHDPVELSGRQTLCEADDILQEK